MCLRPVYGCSWSHCPTGRDSSTVVHVQGGDLDRGPMLPNLVRLPTEGIWPLDLIWPESIRREGQAQTDETKREQGWYCLG